MYERLGLIEESDLEIYRKKLGIKKGVDLMDTEDIDGMIERGQVSTEKAHKR